MIWIKETAYGVTPTGVWNNGPEPSSFVPTDNLNQSEDYLSGSRSQRMSACVSQRRDAGFKLSSVEQARADWISPLLVGALGIATGTEPLGDLPSYSMIYKVGDSRKLYNGCKVNSLRISASEPKAVVAFDSDVWAQYSDDVTFSTPNYIIAGLQNVTLGTFPTATELAGLQVTPPVLFGASRVNPLSWSIDIANNLERGKGSVTGADTIEYPVSPALHEGRRSIIYECELYLDDLTYLDAVLVNSDAPTVSFGLGGVTLTLSDGKYIADGSENFKFEQNPMKQKLRMRFETATIS
jgi:hypothetical protein